MRDQNNKGKHLLKPLTQKKRYIQGGETKIMRKITAYLLIFALVFTLVTPVGIASANTAGERLQALGLIQGGTGGDLMNNSEWTRQDLVVVLSRLLGEEGVAQATAKSHTFADVTNPFYDSYLSWSVKEGYIEGHSATKFGFGESISNQQFVAVMLRALGYDTRGAAYAGSFALGIEKGLVAPGTDASAVAPRGLLYGVIENVLEAELADGTMSLGAALGIEGYEEVAAEVTVVSSAVVDAKTFTVTFSDGVTETFELETALVANVATDVEVKYLDKAYTVSVTFVVEAFEVASVSAVNASNMERAIVSDALVLADSSIKVRFNETLDSDTVNANNIMVKETVTGTVAAATSVTYLRSLKEVTYNVANALKNDTEYTVVVTTGIKSSDGETLAEEYSVNFKTSNHPVIQSQSPGSTTNWNTDNVSVVFNRAMDASTLNSGTVKLYNTTDSKFIAGTVALAANGRNLTFTADAVNLDVNKKYTLTIDSSAKALDGVSVAGDYVKTFIRGTAPDVNVGTIRVSNTTTPFNNVYPKITASGGNAAFNIFFQWNVAMDESTLNVDSIVLRDTSNGNDVDVTFSYDSGSRYLTLTPTADLKDRTNYEVRFTQNEIKSEVGLRPTGAVAPISFSTGDFTNPTVVSSEPAQGAAGVARNAQIKVLFSEAMDNTGNRLTASSTLTTDTQAANYNSNAAIYRLKNESTGDWLDMTSADMNFSVAWNAGDNSLVFSKPDNFAFNTTYTLYVRGEISGATTTNVRDSGSQNLPLKEEYKVSFTTVAQNLTAPVVTAVTGTKYPSGSVDVEGANNVRPDRAIKMVFDKALTTTTVTANTELGNDGGIRLQYKDAAGAWQTLNSTEANSLTFEDGGRTVVLGLNNLTSAEQATIGGREARIAIQGNTVTGSNTNAMSAKNFNFVFGQAPTLITNTVPTITADTALVNTRAAGDTTLDITNALKGTSNFAANQLVTVALDSGAVQTVAITAVGADDSGTGGANSVITFTPALTGAVTAGADKILPYVATITANTALSNSRVTTDTTLDIANASKAGSGFAVGQYVGIALDSGTTQVVRITAVGANDSGAGGAGQSLITFAPALAGDVTAGAAKILPDSNPRWVVSPARFSTVSDANRGDNVTVVVQSTREISIGTINTNTVYLENAETGDKIAGTISVTYYGTLARVVLNPTLDLAASTTYNVVIDGVRDVNGNVSPRSTYVFQTQDLARPSISTFSPAKNSSNFALDGTMTFEFNRALNPDTVNATNITFAGTGAATLVNNWASITLSDDGKTVTIKPNFFLAADSSYTVTFGAGVQSAGGRAMLSDSITFHTTNVAKAPKIASATMFRGGDLNVMAGNIMQIKFESAVNVDHTDAAAVNAFVNHATNVEFAAGTVGVAGSANVSAALNSSRTTLTITFLTSTDSNIIPGISTVSTDITDINGVTYNASAVTIQAGN